MTSFTKFLARAKVTDNPAGDLIEDMRRDKTLPPRFGSIEEMCAHLSRRGACPGALEAAPEVWHRYRVRLAGQERPVSNVDFEAPVPGADFEVAGADD